MVADTKNSTVAPTQTYMVKPMNNNNRGWGYKQAPTQYMN